MVHPQAASLRNKVRDIELNNEYGPAKRARAIMALFDDVTKPTDDKDYKLSNKRLSVKLVLTGRGHLRDNIETLFNDFDAIEREMQVNQCKSTNACLRLSRSSI